MAMDEPISPGLQKAIDETKADIKRAFNSREFLIHPEGDKADPSEPLAEESAPVMRRVKARRI
jgi:hypothetical protein